MKKFIAIIAAFLAASTSFADEATFESVQQEFQQKVLSLVSEENASFTDLETKIAKFADETFGAHPDLMRKEAEKRFKSLPQFPDTGLTAYREHKLWDQIPVPPLEIGLLWLIYG
jgi:Na+-translocating ferredoxin:NAD+ oxidoreductase RnfG subunit